jgi:exopolysaccharide production protein ExoQ
MSTTTTSISLAQIRPFRQAIASFPAIVGFYFSFRLLSVLIAVRIFRADPQTGVFVSLGLNYILFGLAAFDSLGPGSRTFRSFASTPSFRWSLVFLAFSGCSLFWTSTASFPAAVAFWCAMACDFAIVVMLLRSNPLESTALALMKGYVWGSCAIAVISWMLPSQSDLRLGDEELLGPNQIGYACAFAFFLAQFLIRRNQKGWTLPAAFLAITLLRSLSKTTIIAFVVAQAWMFIRDRSMTWKTRVWMVLASIILVALFWNLIDAYIDFYANAGNQSETLTGRLGIWAYILNEAIQQPWIGHGFHSVWKVIPPFGPFEARHAHNELLQQFYAYGAVGVCIVFALYRSVFREIRSLQDASMKAFFVGMFLFILVRGLADTEVFDLSLPLWSIVLIGSLIEQSRIPRASAIRSSPAPA